MNRTLTSVLSVLLLSVLFNNVDAQTVTSTPENWTTLVPSNSCASCTITIPTGYTLVLNSAGTCTGCTFTGGGTVVVAASFKFFTTTNTLNNLKVNIVTAPYTGSLLSFTNDSIAISVAMTLPTVNFTSDSIYFNSGSSLNVNSSTATFTNNYIKMTAASIKTSHDLDVTGGTIVMNTTSSITVLGNADFESAVINMNGSAGMSFSNDVIFGTGTDLTIGDGTGTSTANVVSKGNFSVLGHSFIGIASTGNFLKRNNANYIDDYGTISLSSSTVNGCASLSNSGPVTCVTLAVANLSLSATPLSADKVDLAWTDNETKPADHYLLQREAGDQSWTTIATINAGSYSNGDYRYIDNDAPAGTVDYRIIRVDGNGRSLYSPVSVVSIAAGNNEATVSIHPNPSVGGTFYVTAPNSGKVIINVYTMTGQLLFHTEGNGQTQYTVHLPSQTIGSGAVVVQTIARGVTKSSTMLVR